MWAAVPRGTSLAFALLLPIRNDLGDAVDNIVARHAWDEFTDVIHTRARGLLWCKKRPVIEDPTISKVRFELGWIQVTIEGFESSEQIGSSGVSLPHLKGL